MTTVTSSTGQQQKHYLRLATIADLDEIVDSGLRAFLRDPVMNYIGNVKKMLEFEVDAKACADLRAFFLFLFKAAFLVGGRITVVATSDPEGESNKGDKIVGGALWLPPRRRLAVWMVPTMLKAGVISVLRRWGFTGLLRIVFEYQARSESKMHKLLKKKGLKMSPDDSWYLQLMFTDPEYEGKGIMSQLVREAFAYSPESTFTLEATTLKSRDRYTHLGFEFPTPIKFGKGKADERGVAASGSDANGVEIWAMAKWPAEEQDTQDIQRKKTVSVPNSNPERGSSIS